MGIGGKKAGYLSGAEMGLLTYFLLCSEPGPDLGSRPMGSIWTCADVQLGFERLGPRELMELDAPLD